MRSDLSEASSVMVEGGGGETMGARERKWSREKEEIPGVTLPGGMDSSPSVSHCWECRRVEEAEERGRQLLVNPLIDTNQY